MKNSIIYASIWIYFPNAEGVIINNLPDYILIYNTQDPQSGYHLFPCINSSIKEQNDMEAMSYPSPNGNYIVFSLGEELPSEPIDMNKLLRKLFPSWEKDVLLLLKL